MKIIAIIYHHHDAHCRLPNLFKQSYKLVECISVARVQPRTSKGITDLFLPQLPCRLRSRSLTELTRQITEQNKNGTAPQDIESRKSYQSVIIHCVCASQVDGVDGVDGVAC